MTLITALSDRKKVGLHVLLIGVGRYPHLEGGKGQSRFDECAGMNQLTSPYHSVLAFMDWLQTEHSLADTPLRSLRTLGSLPVGSTPWTAPTLANIEASVDEWHDDADEHEENFALFYFCGHGIQVGSVTALLAEDFGKKKNRPFSGSFDPNMFGLGMMGCRAKRQLFILDACTTAVPGLLAKYGAITPSPLIQELANHGRFGVTKQAQIRASELGTPAYGKVGRPSVFMESFLKSMEGAGAQSNGRGRYEIQTHTLRAGVDWLVQRAEGKMRQLVDFGSSSSNFPLHELQAHPVSPVMVICEPDEALGTKRLFTSAGHSRIDVSPDAWHLDMPAGYHDFSAEDVVSGAVSNVGHVTHPPYMVVAIPCGGKP
jgi:hypothetical protein